PARGLGRDDPLRRCDRAGDRASATAGGDEDRGGCCRRSGRAAAGRTCVKCAELFNIAGQGAIVTGAGSGLGLAIAEALAESGARVTLLDVDAGRIAAETERLRTLGYAVRGEWVGVCDHVALGRAFDASVAAYQCEPAIGSAYMAAKAGAAHLMRCVALELAAFNITVNAIAPGFFVTNIGGGHAKNPDVQAAMAKLMPMHRVGFPDDIKGLALFLASPASAYLTGQQITIDGGWTLGVAD